jgi:hypothetical protein
VANAVTAFGDQAVLLRSTIWPYYFEGLSDDEMAFEPAPDMWGVRLKTDLRTPLEEGAVDGPYWMDTASVERRAAPFTTIAWRIAHLTLGTWNWNAIIAGTPVPPEPALLADADGALALWRSVLDAFVDMTVGFSDAELDADVDAWGGKEPRAGLVSHVCLEIAYHSAEVGTLRHLYRATR